MDKQDREILSHEIVTDQSDPRMIKFREERKDFEKGGLRKTVKLEITEYKPGPDKIKVTTQFGYYEGEPPPGYHELWRKLFLPR